MSVSVNARVVLTERVESTLDAMPLGARERQDESLDVRVPLWAVLALLADAQDAEHEAIKRFVLEVSVAYQAHSGKAVDEDMVIAVERFGVPVTAFFENVLDAPTEVQAAAARRAYREENP